MYQKYKKAAEPEMDEQEVIQEYMETSKKYVAVIGVSFTKPRKARFEPGEEIPAEFMNAIPKKAYDWLLGERNAVKEVG